MATVLEPPTSLFSLPDCTVRNYESRAAWKAARTGELHDRVGASELAALFGASAYDSQFSLYSRRVDPAVWAEAVEAESERMAWGHLVEELILRQYAATTGHDCQAWPQTDICVASAFPGFCTPDALAVDDAGPVLVELKGYSEHDRARWADGPPLAIVLQSLMQQEVTGIHRGRVIVLFGNQIRRLGVFNVDYDESFAAAIRQRCERFAYYVRNREEPPIDESTMTAEAILRLHPSDNGETADIPSLAEFDPDAAFIERDEIKKQIKGAEQRLAWIDNRFKASIGDNTFGVTPGARWLSWKTQERRGVNAAKLKAEFPDVYAACENASSFRVLRTMAGPPRD